MRTSRCVRDMHNACVIEAICEKLYEKTLWKHSIEAGKETFLMKLSSNMSLTTTLMFEFAFDTDI